jgi:hypothetical protein
MEDARDKVVGQDEPVDLHREIQEEIESTDPDRWTYQTERTKELKRPEPILCDSSSDSGEEDEANKEEMKQHLHRLFGHFNWAAIKQASEHIEGAELVKLLKLAGSLPDEHCSGCVEGKSRMMPQPKGRTERPIPRGRPEKLYVDLSGRIEEGSVFHLYHYHLTGLTEFGFAFLTGLAFKSQALLGCAKIFNMPHFRQGKLERFHATIKGSGRTMMFDFGVSLQFWCYAMVNSGTCSSHLQHADDGKE